MNYLTQGGRLQEFEANCTVFKYQMDSQKKYERTLIFVLDTAIENNELDKMKQGILQTLLNGDFGYCHFWKTHQITQFGSTKW